MADSLNPSLVAGISKTMNQMPGQEKLTPQDQKFLCKVCQRPSLTFCSNCEEVFYCSRDHQAIDWPTHKLACLNSVKYLQSRDAFDRKKNIRVEQIRPLDNESNAAILVLPSFN